MQQGCKTLITPFSLMELNHHTFVFKNMGIIERKHNLFMQFNLAPLLLKLLENTTSSNVVIDRSNLPVY